MEFPFLQLRVFFCLRAVGLDFVLRQVWWTGSCRALGAPMMAGLSLLAMSWPFYVVHYAYDSRQLSGPGTSGSEIAKTS